MSHWVADGLLQGFAAPRRSAKRSRRPAQRLLELRNTGDTAATRERQHVVLGNVIEIRVDLFHRVLGVTAGLARIIHEGC